jgi:hypothetical protein
MPKKIDQEERVAVRTVRDALAVERTRSAELRAQLRAATLTRDMLATWVTELQDELDEYRQLADRLAAELERFYAQRERQESDAPQS